MKNQKMKMLAMGSIAAMAMAASGQAAAVWDARATGPVWINGYISVDNTLRPGGTVPDFACKVKGHGHAIQGTNQIRIDGLQALNRASGSPGAARGCNSVVMRALPWFVNINAVPAPAGTALVSTTNTVLITGINFQATLGTQPGCGTSSGTTGGTVNPGATVLWSQMRHQTDFTDAAYSTLTFTGAPIVETPNLGQNCLLTGILKFTRPLAPVRD